MDLPDIVVPQYYEQDIELEDFLFDGTLLRPGMVVLVADPGERGNPEPKPSHAGQATNYRTQLRNRWCEITAVTTDELYVYLAGLYADGRQHKRRCSIHAPWLVRKDYPYEIEPATGLKISDLPNPNQLDLSVPPTFYDLLTPDAAETADRVKSDLYVGGYASADAAASLKILQMSADEGAEHSEAAPARGVASVPVQVDQYLRPVAGGIISEPWTDESAERVVDKIWGEVHQTSRFAQAPKYYRGVPNGADPDHYEPVEGDNNPQ